MKYKICVYAIAKNEEKFVDRWFNSVKEADYIYVLDTGSTDNTVDKLKELGVVVDQKIIDPWRFDVARNEALKMVKDDVDICVSIDLDEVLLPGWKDELGKIWDENVTRLHYTYNWSLDDNNRPIISFYSDKIHKRNCYEWIHPVHEVLNYIGDSKEIIKTTNNITINHFPDKNKSRSGYLPLLELSVEENPTDDRNMHYLGREYMFYERWNDCIDTLIKHLNLKTATWKDERSASMRFIARSYKKLKRYDEAKMWLDKAMKETPYLRDPYVERALLEYELNNLNETEKYCIEALKIKTHEKTYVNERFSWDETIYDLLSIVKYNKKDYDKSLYYINKALEINPNNKRILKNKELIEKEKKDLI
ncbi:glycosyl transferase family 2 [Clostridium sp. CAG:1193]|nr:glycosyl transferase family 2 [Clostridium sp. CAG:1193]